MKSIILGLMVAALAGDVLAIDKAGLDKRIRLLTTKFDALQQLAEKRIPADILRKAQGMILLDRTKAGFIFAYQGGAGVALVRDPKTQEWSVPAFVHADEASLGLQIGGEQNFFVILIMDDSAMRLLTESKFEFGGEARGTAGDSSSGVEGKITPAERPVRVYDDRKGLFGGVSIKGGAVSPDTDANLVYYEQAVSMKDILSGKNVKMSEAATALIARIKQYSTDAKP